LAAGSVVDVEQLLQEVSLHAVESRLGIDPNAAVLRRSDQELEATLQLRKRIASTLSGTGVATSRKVLRDETLELAGRVNALSSWITDVAGEVNQTHDNGDLVLVEGTQGFGLSLHHGDVYPYRTSRDTTAAGFLSEVGLSPFTVTDIVLVVRTFPIRVGGHSGPLANEISWEDVRHRSGYPRPVEEYTSVSKTLRRIGLFDMAIVKRAASINRPTHIAVHGLDYLSYKDYGITNFDDLSEVSRSFVQRLEDTLGVSATFLFTGPPNECLIDRRSRESRKTFSSCEAVRA
jgi:adenylosuccinate synthase